MRTHAIRKLSGVDSVESETKQRIDPRQRIRSLTDTKEDQGTVRETTSCIDLSVGVALNLN